MLTAVSAPKTYKPSVSAAIFHIPLDITIGAWSDGRLLPPPARWMVSALLLEPLLALGGRFTSSMLAAIDLLGWLSTAAAECTHLVSAGALVGVALVAGLAIGVLSLLLRQRLRTNKSNLQLLQEDLRGIPGLIWQWLFYGIVSSAYSRLAANDARVSYGEASVSKQQAAK